MLSATRYLHSKGIIHRDLKLENFLLSSSKPDSELLMIDFGLSKHFEIGQSHCTMVGTLYTCSPEIFRGSYDETADIWALGVIAYMLLSGDTPFGGLDGENSLQVRSNILRATVAFTPTDTWANVSDGAKSFVLTLLNPNPKTRPTAKAMQKHPWIAMWAKRDAKEGNQLSPETVRSLLAFKESSDMQKLLFEVLSFTLLPQQCVDLRKEFDKISDGDAEISIVSMKRALMNTEAGSPGALKEQEIESIFDSIRVRKAAPTLRWHEFLAAGISQAHVDDRNLRLAFDSLDTERKG
jgi:calcium-dependent protein kinase